MHSYITYDAWLLLPHSSLSLPFYEILEARNHILFMLVSLAPVHRGWHYANAQQTLVNEWEMERARTCELTWEFSCRGPGFPSCFVHDLTCLPSIYWTASLKTVTLPGFVYHCMFSKQHTLGPPEALSKCLLSENIYWATVRKVKLCAWSVFMDFCILVTCTFCNIYRDTGGEAVAQLVGHRSLAFLTCLTDLGSR